MNFPESLFWNYSCQLFQIADVADTCLQMQNTFEADVNLLLFCCWAGDNRRQLSETEIDNLIRASEPWQTAIIKPLREARKLMKNQIIAMPASLHTQTINNLSEMELNAEHMAQLDLEKTIGFDIHSANAAVSAIDTSARNLMLYVQKLEKTQVSDVTVYITGLLKHVYGDDEMVQMAMMSAMA
ncbi:MAG: TIGR02444 family protein [Gammaproteobacteria bacterium]|nr:TIGR02444 family protein [Gammaproteobacteria bacterium]